MSTMGNSAASCATQNQHYQAISMGRATCMTLGCGSRNAEKRDQQQVELSSKAPLHVIMYSLIDNAGIAKGILHTAE